MNTDWYQLNENSKDHIKDLQTQRNRDRLARKAMLARREHERLARPDFNLRYLLRNLSPRPMIRRVLKQA